MLINYIFMKRIYHEAVSNTRDIERYQRWMQIQLAETENIEDLDERDRRRLQLEISISEIIKYREFLEKLDDRISSPFVEVTNEILPKPDQEVTATVKVSGECATCGESLSPDIDFCPFCGNF